MNVVQERALEYGFKRAELFIDTVKQKDVDRYSEYWESIKPETPEEYRDRWLFAFMSVRTGWKKNVESFNAIRKLSPDIAKPDLLQAIKNTKCGFYGMRATGIHEFNRRFGNKQEDWKLQPNETFEDCRARLLKITHGLGLAKLSFAFELAYPNTCDIVCLDAHMLRLYEQPNHAPSDSTYAGIEDHWAYECQRRKFPVTMVRHMYWDYLKKRSNCRYWSHVFEKAA